MEENKKNSKKFFGYFPLIAFLFFIAVIFYSIDQIYLPKLKIDKMDFRIEPEEKVSSILEKLKSKGLIGNKFIIKTYLVFNRIDKRIKSGSYLIEPGDSVKEIFEKFIQGKEIEVLIIEGMTNLEIAKILKEEGVIDDQEKFYQLTKNFDSSILKNYQFLPLNQESGKVDLEGYLFPDTYKFNQSLDFNSQILIIKKMLDNFNEKVYKKLENNLGQENFRKIIIIASMLEKEIKTKEDMELVSGILEKRLKNNIPLQVDATLIYIKCDILREKNCRNLSESDKKINSPYNTYLFKNLPPGPISNPGIKALEAALNPKISNFWYYLSVKDGKTIFSKTLNEHNLNKRKYLSN